MNGGPRHLESFEDVEAEFRTVRVERADAFGELKSDIGGLTAEVSGVRREVGELRRVLVEGGVQFVHRTDDTGSHDLRATYAKLKAVAADPASSLKPADVRKIVRDFTEEMSLRADARPWRWLKAQAIRYAAKAFWLALFGGGGYLLHWITGRH